MHYALEILGYKSYHVSKKKLGPSSFDTASC